MDGGRLRCLSCFFTHSELLFHVLLLGVCLHEPLTPPDISFNSTFHPSNESCTVSLECVSTSDSNVNYRLSVRNQTLVGPRLWYNIRPQDGDTKFTCTIFNSESSTSETVTCSNEEKPPPSASPVPLVIGLVWWHHTDSLPLAAAVVLVQEFKELSQPLRTNQSSDPTVHHDEIQLQVYSSLLHGDDCIYESIRGDTEEGTRGDPDNV
ncbi:unnamed protein product [Pleuronectes platessa]|uniref:Ig-like domain-containing protein n=1 Tax=Pleuronectes platessa TaxID=8262 RepID=A0A9N7ZAR6_PLEPL|nr:unnamed protein product [Pleuronectes platessa]